MKLITKDIHYAIKALLYIARDPSRVVSVNELVKKLEMRKAFLRRILQVLSRQGILRSSKGRGGGFMLHINPDKIRLIDIVDIFRDDMDIFSCLFEKDVCFQPTKCLLMKEIKKAEERLNNALKRLTIAKLFKSINGQV